jgi:hypothetical protein
VKSGADKCQRATEEMLHITIRNHCPAHSNFIQQGGINVKGERIMKGMKSMKVKAMAVLLTVLPGLTQAETCQSAAKVAGDIFDKVGTEAIALGCSAVKVAMGKEETFGMNDLLECYKDASFYTNLAKSLNGWWNNQVANNGSLTIGPRHLTIDTDLDGTLVSTSGRMFISFPMEKDAVTITINERDGKAKTSVVACKHKPDGKWEEVATRWFNDSNDQKGNKKESRKIELQGVKGYEVSLHLDSKAVLGDFAYTVRAKD